MALRRVASGLTTESFTIGTQLAANAGGPAAAELDPSFTRQYPLTNVTIANKSDFTRNHAEWEFSYPGNTWHGWPDCSWNSDPPLLSHIAHSTSQATIWRATGQGLAKGFSVVFATEVNFLRESVGVGLGTPFRGGPPATTVPRPLHVIGTGL